MDPSISQIMDFLIKRLQRRVCALWSGTRNVDEAVGTGAFVLAGRRHLIATCAHVAQPFFTDQEAHVVLADGASIPRASCSLYLCDAALDLALIAIDTPSDSYETFALSQFADAPDMRAHDFTFEHIVVCGFPGARVGKTPKGRTMNPIIYLTEIDPSQTPTVERFSCRYPLGPGQVIGEAGPSTLPRPHGLSGSLIFTIPAPNAPKDELWSLEYLRIVGVAVESNVRTYVEAASTYPLLTALRTLEGEA